MGFLDDLISKIGKKPKDKTSINENEIIIEEESQISLQIEELNDIQNQLDINAEYDRTDPNGMRYPRYGQCTIGLCDDYIDEKRIFRCKLCHQWMCAQCLINHKCDGDGSEHYGKITYLGDGRIRYQPKKSGK